MERKNKVIIISYFYPPCNLTGGRRAHNWANSLSVYDVYPIVVTRSWEHEIGDYLDLSKPSGEEDTHEKFDTHEVHYLKHKGNFKDRYVHIFGVRFKIIRKLLSFIELIFQNLNIRFSPYKNIYNKTYAILKTCPEISTVIISAMPFNQFLIGYTLKKKFPQIKWIADYRDEWTSRPNFEMTITNQFLINWDKKFEIKWLAKADHFTYVDDYYLHRIQSHINHNSGHAILNGFNQIYGFEHHPKKNELILTFPGSLYSHQNIDFFAKVIVLFHKNNPGILIEVNFIGSAVNENVKDKILSSFGNYVSLINITPRISEKELFDKYLRRTHAILMFPINDMKNIIPTKMISNLPLGIPMLFIPSDGGAIDKLISKGGLGLATADQEEISSFFEELAKLKIKKFSTENKEVQKYSRYIQTHKLAKLIKE